MKILTGRSMLAVVLVSCLAWSAHAGVTMGDLSLSAGAGWFEFEGSRLKGDWLYTLTLDYALSNDLQLEFAYSYTRPNGYWPDQGQIVKSRVDVHILGFDAVFNLPTGNSPFAPYLLVGSGMMSRDYRVGPTTWDGFMEYGGGFRYYFNHCVALRLDARHVYLFAKPHNALRTFAGLDFTIPSKHQGFYF